MGSIPGATIGGFILALGEELGAGYVSSGYRDARDLRSSSSFAVTATGLFARRSGSVKAGLTILFLAVLVSLPLWLDNAYRCTSSSSRHLHHCRDELNLLLGYAGRYRSATLPFFGIGAYASALVSLGFKLTVPFEPLVEAKPVWLAMLMGIVVEPVRLVHRRTRLQGARRVLVSSRSASPRMVRLVAVNGSSSRRDRWTLTTVRRSRSWPHVLEKPENTGSS